jgi:hypothetical protein
MEFPYHRLTLINKEDKCDLCKINIHSYMLYTIDCFNGWLVCDKCSTNKIKKYWLISKNDITLDIGIKEDETIKIIRSSGIIEYGWNIKSGVWNTVLDDYIIKLYKGNLEKTLKLKVLKHIN